METTPAVGTKEGWIKVRHVPYIFAIHDCLGGIASGMTVKCVCLYAHTYLCICAGCANIAAAGALHLVAPTSLTPPCQLWLHGTSDPRMRLSQPNPILNADIDLDPEPNPKHKPCAGSCQSFTDSKSCCLQHQRACWRLQSRA